MQRNIEFEWKIAVMLNQLTESSWRKWILKGHSFKRIFEGFSNNAVQ